MPDTSARKIVQIAVSEGEDDITVVALCADGTAWKLQRKWNGPNTAIVAWEKLPPIPAG